MSTPGIDRRAGLSHEEFFQCYLLPLRPVILTDAIRGWPALSRWTPEFFRDRYGHLEARVDGAVVRLGELIGEILASTPERPARYLHNQPFDEWPAELRDDVSPLPECTQPNWLESRLFPPGASMICPELYFGGRGAAFPIVHYDGLHTHAFIMEVFGSKQFWACGPEQTAFLYPRSGVESNKSQVDDVEHPDLARFPLFARVEPIRFVLQAGETLFVPAGWWHTTRLLTSTISVSVNAVNAANWTEFRRDYCASLARKGRRARAWAMAGYLTALGPVLDGLDALEFF